MHDRIDLSMQALYDFYNIYAAELVFALVIVAALLLLWVIILQIRLGSLNRRYRAAMKGAEGTDMESLLTALNRTMTAHQQQISTLEKRSDATEKIVAAHAGNVGMVRFNPFNDTGGDQSFSIAWVDTHANGVVLSSLHNRTGTRVYAKPVTKGDSSHNLTEEERQAIKSATTN
jgi:hypothetical protein